MRTQWIDRLLFVAALVVCCTGNGAAQTDSLRTIRLREAEVSAPHRPSSMRATAPVQTVSGEEIRRLGVTGVADVVKHFNGVVVRDYGGIGGLKTVSVRGMGAHHTNVVYDGLAVSNCQAGQIDIGRFPLDQVAMVSLSTGQSDDIFQPAKTFASAGVLHIRTEQPSFDAGRKIAVQTHLKGGSFGFVNPSLRLALKCCGKTSLSMDGDFLRADGTYPFTLTNGLHRSREKRYNSDILSWHAEANLLMHPNDSSHWMTKVYYYQSQRGLPGSVVFYNPQTHERLWDRNFFAQTAYETRLNPLWQLKAAVKYNYSWDKYRDTDSKYEKGQQTDRNTQQEWYATAAVLFRPANHLSLVLTSDFTVNRLRNNFDNAPSPTRSTSLTALAAKYESSVLTLNVSLLNTYTHDHVQQGERPPHREKVTPSIGLSIRPWSDGNMHLRLLYKHSYRLPSFNDLYYQRVGNTGIRPELAREYNAGITWNGTPGNRLSYLSLTLDGYYNRIRDKIIARPTTYVWKMMNRGKVEITGVDAAVAATVAVTSDISLHLSAGYTFQRAIDITDRGDKCYEDQIPYTPRHSANGLLHINTPWAGLSYSVIGVGERYSLPQNIRDNRIPGYAEHSVSLSREFSMNGHKLRLQADLVNFTDKQYDIIRFYPMPGRSYRLGATWTL